jgi:hypothetical protein
MTKCETKQISILPFRPGLNGTLYPDKCFNGKMALVFGVDCGCAKMGGAGVVLFELNLQAS